ncbi:MAG: BLUF domain-containing protein [Ginsengibacter sp.]
MIELIYYSIASPSLKKDDVSNILEVSRKNNIKNDITGCLLFYNDAFIQILEGSREIIDRLYAKIEQDERHYNIREVYNGDIPQRLFKDWSMAFYDLEKDAAAREDKLNFRKKFLAISEHNEQSTMASQLFWDISNQLLNE